MDSAGRVADGGARPDAVCAVRRRSGAAGAGPLPGRPGRGSRHGAPAARRVTYASPMPRKRAAEPATGVPPPWPRPAKIAFIGSHGIRKTTALLAFAAEVQRAGRSVELGREVV